MNGKQIYDEVQEHYGSAAKTTNGEHGRNIAIAFGYSMEELASIPSDANLGLSCGNPLATAKIRQGETVVDLGSGGGLDVFLAAEKVGPEGKAIGIDMNKDMLALANRNKDKSDAKNVFFVESPITNIALPPGTADCIISNCVVNLVPEEEKQLVFNEMFRLLKPGGRVAISDILARKTLPDEVKRSMALYVGCIAGASQVNDYEKYLQTAGFNDVLIVDEKSDLNVYGTAGEEGGKSLCCGPGAETSGCGTKSTSSCSKDSGDGTHPKTDIKVLDFNDLAGSFKIYAVKP